MKDGGPHVSNGLKPTVAASKDVCSREMDIGPESWLFPEPKLRVTWTAERVNSLTTFCVRIAKLLNVTPILKHYVPFSLLHDRLHDKPTREVIRSGKRQKTDTKTT